MSSKPLDLVRGLGPWASVAIVVGTMIGTGIFIVPADMARDAKSVGLVMLVWIAGGALSLFGALSYAELGAALPEAGGEYAYMRRAYGPAWGFLFGWMHSIVGRPTSVATIAAGLLRFCGFLFPATAATIFTWHFALPGLKPYDFVFTRAQPLAVVAIAAVTFVNYLGVRLGGQVQVTLTVIKIAAVVAVVAVGFSLGHGNAANFHPLFAGSGTLTVAGLLTALVGALWAYDGWSNVNLVGSEVVDPQKNIPRALLGGVLLVVGLYVVMTLACFFALPLATVAASPHVASDVVASLLGHKAAVWLTLAMIICALGTMNSSILSGARVDYAMARDGIFFRAAAGVHWRFRTPARALVFQGCLASVLALTGTFEDLYSLFIFAGWIFYGLATASVIWLRIREPQLARPYRTWGYPVVPALFILGATALTVSIFLDRPVRCFIGLALILSGLLFYQHWQKSSPSQQS
ncbi:MAG: APC family permease [Candidatus Acidiferrales bacterium]